MKKSDHRFPCYFAAKGKNGFASTEGRLPTSYSQEEAEKEEERLIKEEGLESSQIMIVIPAIIKED
ncbi:MAG: hypothetical protein HQ537_01600 [Parcubacteria group bacterium]|nr:hypothetical protein [Parcubacteria group bacterium]